MASLTGSLVRLRPPKEEDYEYLAGLSNDFETQGWNQRLPPRSTPESIKEKIEKRNKDPNSATLAIETLDGALCGTINYHESPPRLSASIGIVMGKEHWGKGYAREAQEMLLEYLFEERGVQIIRLWTLSLRDRAMAAAEKVGFKVAARVRENSILEGKVCDTIVMDQTREEYYARTGKADKIMVDKIE